MRASGQASGWLGGWDRAPAGPRQRHGLISASLARPACPRSSAEPAAAAPQIHRHRGRAEPAPATSPHPPPLPPCRRGAPHGPCRFPGSLRLPGLLQYVLGAAAAAPEASVGSQGHAPGLLATVLMKGFKLAW